MPPLDLLASVLAAIGAAAAVFAARHQLRVRAARSWASTPGRVRSVRVVGRGTGGDEHRRRTYSVRVTYDFEVDGRSYTGHRDTLAPAAPFHERAEAQARAAALPIGSEVLVWFDPRSPDRCCLQRSFELASVAWTVVALTWLPAAALEALSRGWV